MEILDAVTDSLRVVAQDSQAKHCLQIKYKSYLVSGKIINIHSQWYIKFVVRSFYNDINKDYFTIDSDSYSQAIGLSRSKDSREERDSLQKVITTALRDSLPFRQSVKRLISSYPPSARQMAIIEEEYARYKRD